MRFQKIYLEITNICNRDCAFCPKTGRAPEFMPPDRFALLCQRLRPYTDYLYFHLMGEPLLHPQLEEFLALAGELGFRVILTTNGTLIPEKEELLLRADALHKVNLSLHSFEANEGGSLHSYLEGCVGFAHRASAAGKLINLRLWNLDGEDIRGLRQRNPEILSLLQAHFPGPWPQVRGGLKLGERVYLSWGEIFRWPSMEQSTQNAAHSCYGLRDQIGVLCDGTVVPCCLDHEGELSLGNLCTEPLDRILEQPRALAILEGFRRGRAVEPLCQRCGYANRFAK